jgi:iron-sulfur cluster assembly protein
MTSLLPGMGPTISKSEGISALTNDDVMVTVTERASSKAKELLASKGFPDAYLRVFVVGGGCSGFQYGMSIAESADDTDKIIELEHVRVVVDKDSVPMISGAEIDYVEDLMKSGFTIHNPNATSSCACGSSFQTADGSGVARPCS